MGKARRDRTRHLIELGGLVLKADLVELLDDDRATLLGALLDVASQLRNGDDTGTTPADLVARWRRRGLRVFEADKDADAAQPPAAPSSATRTPMTPLNQEA